MPRKPVESISPTPAIPAPGEGKRGIDGYLAYLLRQANAAVRLTFERLLVDVGVTPPQFVVLTMLNAYPGLSGAELARLSLLSPQTVSLITRNLERLGAIAKQRHPGGGRLLQFTLTAHGHELLAVCRGRAQTLEERIAARLTPETERIIRHWLADLATALNGESPRAMTYPAVRGR